MFIDCKKTVFIVDLLIEENCIQKRFIGRRKLYLEQIYRQKKTVFRVNLMLEVNCIIDRQSQARFTKM